MNSNRQGAKRSWAKYLEGSSSKGSSSKERCFIGSIGCFKSGSSLLRDRISLLRGDKAPRPTNASIPAVHRSVAGNEYALCAPSTLRMRFVPREQHQVLYATIRGIVTNSAASPTTAIDAAPSSILSMISKLLGHYQLAYGDKALTGIGTNHLSLPFLFDRLLVPHVTCTGNPYQKQYGALSKVSGVFANIPTAALAAVPFANLSVISTEIGRSLDSAWYGIFTRNGIELDQKQDNLIQVRGLKIPALVLGSFVRSNRAVLPVSCPVWETSLISLLQHTEAVPVRTRQDMHTYGDASVVSEGLGVLLLVCTSGTSQTSSETTWSGSQLLVQVCLVQGSQEMYPVHCQTDSRLQVPESGRGAIFQTTQYRNPEPSPFVTQYRSLPTMEHSSPYQIPLPTEHQARTTKHSIPYHLILECVEAPAVPDFSRDVRPYEIRADATGKLYSTDPEPLYKNNEAKCCYQDPESLVSCKPMYLCHPDHYEEFKQYLHRILRPREELS